MKLVEVKSNFQSFVSSEEEGVLNTGELHYNSLSL